MDNEPTLWNRTFAKLIADEQLVEVYRKSGENDLFGLGRVLGMSEDYLGLTETDAMGTFDGFRLMKRDAILRIQWGGDYETKRYQNAVGSIPKDIPQSLVSDPNIATVLAECRVNGTLCQFRFKYRFTGRVLDFDEASVLIELFEENLSAFDGYCQLPLEDLEYVEFQSQDLLRQEAVLRKLSEARE